MKRTDREAISSPPGSSSGSGSSSGAPVLSEHWPI
jgi:hypothetical protein